MENHGARKRMIKNALGTNMKKLEHLYKYQNENIKYI